MKASKSSRKNNKFNTNDTTDETGRRRVWRFRRGPGKFVISGFLAPSPNDPIPSPLQKNLTGFLHYTWTPLHGQLRGVRTPGLPWPATSLSRDDAGKRRILGEKRLLYRVNHGGMIPNWNGNKVRWSDYANNLHLRRGTGRSLLAGEETCVSVQITLSW